MLYEYGNVKHLLFLPKINSMTLHEKFERYIKTLEVIYSLEYQINNPLPSAIERSIVNEHSSDVIHLSHELRPAKTLEELNIDLGENRRALRLLQTELFTILKDLNLNTVKLQVDDLLYLVAPVDRFSMNSNSGKLFKKAGSITYRLIL
jgi:hypothetical protein